ncbi:MAG: mobile mystery protein B [Bacteroidia bacterium]
MGLSLDYQDGQTPLSEEEKDGLLIGSIATRGELDEFEQLNIEKAIEWTLTRKFGKGRVVSEEFVLDLHRKMFEDVWSWAGSFRKSDKNLGVMWMFIGMELKKLLDDCSFWIENMAFSEDEIAIQFSHRIVAIHCFPNGNGRHSRLIADVIISHLFGNPVFTWNRNSLVKKGEARTSYLTAIKQADKGNIQPLISFART